MLCPSSAVVRFLSEPELCCNVWMVFWFIIERLGLVSLWTLKKIMILFTSLPLHHIVRSGTTECLHPQIVYEHYGVAQTLIRTSLPNAMAGRPCTNKSDDVSPDNLVELEANSLSDIYIGIHFMMTSAHRNARKSETAASRNAGNNTSSQRHTQVHAL